MSRVLKRWIGECEYARRVACDWNERKGPRLHRTSEAAIREASEHAVEAGHVGAREVSIRRTYAPRVVEREEIVGA